MVFRPDVEVDPRHPKKAMREINATAKMEKRLMAAGRPVPGGYMMTQGDLLRFLKSSPGKKGRGRPRI